MKKLIFFTIPTLLIILLTGCSNEVGNMTHNPMFPEECTCSEMSIMTFYQDFEDTLLAGTNIVIAQLAHRRPFGHSMEELEFIVIEQIYGQTAGQIFVYLNHNVNISVSGGEDEITFRETDVEFEKGVDYLLTLMMIDSVVSNFKDDAYFLTSSALVINLNEPTQSTMYNQPLALHATELDFSDSNLSEEDIIAFVAELTNFDANLETTENLDYNNIRSENLADIVNHSPIIVEIEINELIYSMVNCYRASDMFVVTVTQSLKGEFDIGYSFELILFKDTARIGERHIVALREGSFYPHPETGLGIHFLTSRHGMISLDYLDGIIEILNLLER